MTNIDEVSHQLGRHEALLEQVKADVTDIRTDMKRVLSIVDQRKGERRAVAKMAGALGIAGGSIATLVFRFVFHIK